MSLRLVLSDGGRIDVDRKLTVGRLPECDVVIADALVSGRHFEIGPGLVGAQIVDLQSSNGTFVDGQRLVEPRVLQGGEQIAIGSHRILVERVVQVPAADLLLTVRVGPDSGKTARISDGLPVLVGRADDAGLRLSDPVVSARHCQVALVHSSAGPCAHCGGLAVAGDAHCVGCGRQRVAAEVEDLGSANGVLVNGTPVATNGRAELVEGGEIQLGDTVIVFGSASDPVTVGPAPTVIRSIPHGLADAAPAAAAPPPPPPPPPPVPPSRPRRVPVVGWIVLGIAVIAVAVVAVVALSSAGGGTAAAPVGTASAAPHDAVWVQETQRDATVQVFACSYVTKSTCDDTFGWGSGSIIDADLGLVLTNFHVIANDDASQPLSEVSVTVRTNSGEELEAEVVGFSACDDLAVIKITQASDREGLKQVTFADPASIKPGEAVVALGYPGTTQSEAGGMEQLTLTTGNVSAIGVKAYNYIDLVQTDTAINHGNSGGPLFDLYGKQVGVNTLGGPDDTVGINYAISIRRVNAVLADLKAGDEQAGFDSCPE